MSLNLLKKLFIFILLFGFGLPFFAHSAEINPIFIGATVSLEGKYKEPSLMTRDAFNLWEKQVNERGGLLGRPVKLILYNDKSQKDLVKNYYEKLLSEDKVDLLFSPYGTPLTLVASEVSERHGFVMLACAASGEIIWERGYKYVFGVYALAKRYFIGLLDLMSRNGLKSVAILSENNPFNIDVANGTESWAKRFRLSVTYKKAYSNGKMELPGLLKEIRGINPDGLILSAYPPDCYNLLDLMKGTGYRPKVLGLTIVPTHPDFYKNAGSMSERVFGPSQWEPDERIPFPGTKKFVRDFKTFTGKMPSYHAGSAYSACQIIEKALNQVQSLNHREIRDFISSLDTVTVIGRFKVDHKGKQVGHNPIMIQWQNGKKEIVYPTKMQTAPALF
jgi:branched-chain amino acid transport system substrate-binding protein